MTVLVFALSLLAAGLLLPTLSDLVSLVRWPWRRRVRRPVGPPPRLLFLVPAHNEGLLIGACLDALHAMDYPAGRRDVLVIADNCTDDTAATARAAGVRCRERDDTSRRGKPWALAWALEQEPLEAFDAVVIVDADTEVDPAFAAALAAAGNLRGRVVQPYNDVRNRAENALTRMAAVYSMAIHGLSFRLKGRVGLNVPLSVGQCLGTDVLRAHGWTAFSVAEDWETYAILTAHGVSIAPVTAARIYAQEARSLAQSGPQRRRWMMGKLGVLRHYAGALLRRPGLSAAQRLDAVAELSYPGPAIHLGAAVAGAAVAAAGGVPALALLLLGSQVRMAVYALGGILVDREPVRAAMSFGYLPFYAVWRIAAGLAALASPRAREWARTARHVTREGGA